MKTDKIPQNAALSSALPRGTLSEGGSVFVRVIKKMGGGAYLIALAGRQLRVSSDIPLAEHSMLRATVHLADGKIALVRQPENEAAAFSAQKIALDAGADGILSGAAAAYLKKLGLPSDELAASLLANLRELGLHFALSRMRQIYALAKRFTGREKRAAEIALALEQKGLPVDEQTVLAVMADGKGHAHSGQQNLPRKKSQNDEQEDDSADDWKGPVFEREAQCAFKEFFAGLLQETANAKDVKYGVTALFNHRPADRRKTDFTKTWIRLPFAFSYTQDGADGSGSGCVNILIKPDSKSLEKFSVTFSIEERRYAVAFSMNKNAVRSLKFSAPEQERGIDLAAALQKRFPRMEIERADGMSADGSSEFFFDTNFLYEVDGSA